MNTERLWWRKPQVGFFVNNVLIRFGMILRDVVHCQTHKLSGKVEARLAEKLYLKEALSWVYHLSLV